MKNISHTGLGTSTQESKWKSQSCPLRTSTGYLSGRCYTVSLVLFLNLRKYCKLQVASDLIKDKHEYVLTVQKKKLTQTCETKILLSSTF